MKVLLPLIRKYVLVQITAVVVLLGPPTGLAQSSALTQPLPLVSPIFGNNMVLQREKKNTIWGWSEPGRKVTVEIASKSASGTVWADHRWQVKIQPPAAGGPYTLKVKGPQIVELHNVLVGDVWLCGGQSNMQVGLGAARTLY
jgi:sialate O-acetylesterase